jgi:putative transposase
MPSRNTIKVFVEDGIYHIYNRGVNKGEIFHSKEDYKFFLFLLKSYLSPVDESTRLNLVSWQIPGTALQRVGYGAFSDRIELLSFALMPNHYHLLVRQRDIGAVSEFVRAVMTTYVMYFNKKYDRVGSLFQGIYKAVLVKDTDYLIHITRYIHLNPRDKDLQGSTLLDMTSYEYYLGNAAAKWVKPEIVLDTCYEENVSLLDKRVAYRKFVEDYVGESRLGIEQFALD